MSRLKPLASVWHEGRFYSAGPVLRNGTGDFCSRWKALGFHAIKPKWVYHANSCNLPCIWTLYNLTFDVTNQSATSIIFTKGTLNHG